jgi:hypothetical protein
MWGGQKKLLFIVEMVLHLQPQKNKGFVFFGEVQKLIDILF